MADFDLATATGALAQNLKPLVVRTFNSTAVLLRLLPYQQGAGKNVAWDAEAPGANGENFADGADVSAYGIDTPNMATLAWGLYRSNFKISNLGAAAAMTSGSPAGLLRPLARNMTNAARKLASVLSGVGYSGAGTGTTIAGLDVALDDDNTYGGINRASAAFWRTNVFDPGSPTAPTIALLRADIGAIYDASGEKPDLALVNTAGWNKVAGLFADRERYVKDTANLSGRQVTMDASIDAIMVDGCLFVKDKDATAGEVLYLNTAYCHWEWLPPAMEILPPEAKVLQLEDSQGGLGAQAVVYPLARTGAAGKFTLEIQIQLVVEKPNACGVRRNLLTT